MIDTSKISLLLTFNHFQFCPTLGITHDLILKPCLSVSGGATILSQTWPFEGLITAITKLIVMMMIIDDHRQYDHDLE